MWKAIENEKWKAKFYGRLPFNGRRSFNSVGGLGDAMIPPAGPGQRPGGV